LDIYIVNTQKKIIYGKKWIGRHITRISQFTIDDIKELFDASDYFEYVVDKYGSCQIAKGKVLCCLFYEPSTRTSCSFQAAMLRLGGQVITIQDTKTSSIAKGETFEDTVRCLENYCDAMVIRHPETGTPQRAIDCLNRPIVILNAGDGIAEHPTQALLDLYTIYKYKEGSMNNITITFIGDLKYGRTVHSLVPALCLFHNITMYFVSPETLELPKEIIKCIHNFNKINDDDDDNNKRNIQYFETSQLNENILLQTDVMYVTRIQKERFENINDYNKVKSSLIINNETLSKCKSNMILMHPLPRVDEIAPECDKDPRVMYFKQMRNGMFVRMGLLALTLGVY